MFYLPNSSVGVQSPKMVFFTCSGAVALNVQCSLLHLYNFQCLPMRSDIITHSDCCPPGSLVVLAEKKQLCQKPQVPSWLPILLQLWSLEVWSWEGWPATSAAGEPFWTLKLPGWRKLSLWRSPAHFERVAASAHHELYCTSCPGVFYSLDRQKKERKLVSLFLTGLTKKSVSILHSVQHSLWHCHQFVFQQWGGSFICEETKFHCSRIL